jgi:hypothetical protein
MEADCAYQTKAQPKDWTDDEVALLLRLRRERHDWATIVGHFPGRSHAAVVSKFNYLMAAPNRPKLAAIPFVREPTPPEVLADQAKRVAAWAQRSLTASLMGDPPPQFSALARRNRAM